MPGIDPPPSSSVFFPRWQKPAFVIAAVGLLAFIIWTLPNWAEFWSNSSQFANLWQVPTNRRIIIYLTIKVTAPLFFMGIAGISLWIYSRIVLFQGEATRENVDHENVHDGGRAENRRTRNILSSMQEQKLEAPDVSHSAQALVSPAVASRFYDPETPLPPTVSLSEVFVRQEDASRRSVFHAPGEQQGQLAQQRSESSSVGRISTVSPAHPTSEVSHSIVLTSESFATADPLISIRLLKDVSITINVPGGGHVVVPQSLHAKRVQLLAYVAWRRGETIDRYKILEHVFGWGLPDAEATEDKLSEKFESHKKLLRKKIRDVVVAQVNKPAGREIIDPDLDPFVSSSGFWGLATTCRVDDIEAIEADYKVIALARKDGQLVDEVPEYVKEACERLIANYPGDFLESLIKKYPGEFSSWEGRSSWVRKPFTHYRGYYLDALWYAAEYEYRMGQRYTDTGDAGTREGNLHKRQEHFGRAAQRYQNYALFACNSKFDSKATFGAHGPGERIGMSERALRRCVVLLGAIGRTDLVNQVWSAYYTQMKSLSDQRWQPSKETQDDLQAAKAQTSAYRFAAQVSQMSNEFVDRQDRVS